jgi:chromosome partitioning protein
LKQLEVTVSDPQDFWLRTAKPELLVSHQTALASSIPIISVINFKGGVGKTTICANLAGYFVSIGKRVLLIDCDYQGSLSDTVLTHARVDNFQSNAHMLLEGWHDPTKLRMAAERLSAIDSRLSIYPAFYGFSRAEVRMMFRWLIGQDEEIRFNMSRYLQSSAFSHDPATAFDVVLIDAPPRLLTGVVNALTASTHVLVPTILDGQSHVATLNTISAIQQFRQKLNPNLKLLGIVPSMVAEATGYSRDEGYFIDELERQLPNHYGGPVPVLKDQPILKRAALSRAGGSQLLYLNPTNAQPMIQIREMFANLGDYVNENVRWGHLPISDDQFSIPGTLGRQRVAQ